MNRRNAIASLQALMRRDRWMAATVAIVTLMVLVSTAEQGFVRDEGYYFRAAAEYHRWFEQLWTNIFAGDLSASFRDEHLKRVFGYNTEHPGFVKILAGWTWKIFHQWLGWMSHANAYRLASVLMVAVGSGFTYLMGARFFSRPVGLIAAALLFGCPHVFYHAHLACFDGPIMAMGVVTTYAFWRALQSRPWVWWCGVCWGIAIATKHNGIFLLPTLVLAYLCWRAADFRSDRQGLTLPPLPMAMLAMLLIGPAVFYLFYPYGWAAPVERIGQYLSFHLHHEHYPVDYFGVMYNEPPFPWHYPFVMTALTVPIVVLLPACVGLVLCMRRCVSSFLPLSGAHSTALRQAPPNLGAWLLLTATLIPPLIIAVPSVPIFGGTKHWMTMMPFVSLLAAWVLWEGVQYGARFGKVGRVVGWVVVGMLVLLGLWDTARSYPLGHTYYNELAGGHQGGAALGMPRTFWGGDARALLPVLNARAKPGDRVFTDRMNWDSFRMYQKDGLLRTDLRYATEVFAADWAIINHQREYWQNELDVWAFTGTKKPEVVLALEGVPIVSLYSLR